MSERIPEITDLLVGNHLWRSNNKQITCFTNTPGLGIQFTAVAGSVYEVAKERDFGEERRQLTVFLIWLEWLRRIFAIEEPQASCKWPGSVILSSYEDDPQERFSRGNGD